MKRLIILLILTTVDICFAIPIITNYQGFLSSPSGIPLDTTVSMGFAIYAQESGGNVLWSESHASVTVTDGLFNVLLGSVTTLSDVFAGDRWLGITIGSDAQMSPRERIVSVAHSYRVGTIDGATGGNVTGNLALSGKATFGAGHTNGGIGSFIIGQNNQTSLDYSFISGLGNSSYGIASSVAGGSNNDLAGDYALIGSGFGNYTDGNYSLVAGGQSNGIEGNHSVLGGGQSNYVTGGHAALLGGSGNNVATDYATLCGGQTNLASGDYSFLGGGRYNKARGDYSVISGGGGSSSIDSNFAGGQYSAVGGGRRNASSDSFTVVAGGYYNRALGVGAVVCGGYNNVADTLYSTIGGGRSNNATGYGSTIGGGAANTADTSFATAGGGWNNDASGYCTFVGGGLSNIADSSYATVGGGRQNEAGARSSVIGGGTSNVVLGTSASICGGSSNTATDIYASVGGGYSNDATGSSSAIAGGSNNVASGYAAAIPGGGSNRAAGSYSFAAGHGAKAIHGGSFVWADDHDDSVYVAVDNRWVARSSGGVYFYTNATMTTGSYLASGSGTWNSVSDSTKKRNIRQVDTKSILEKVSTLPIKQWSYKSQDEGIEHIGPMAQDFWNQFHVGDDSLSISSVDPNGIALAAIQELVKQNEAKDKQISALDARVKQLEETILQFGNLKNSNKQ